MVSDNDFHTCSAASKPVPKLSLLDLLLERPACHLWCDFKNYDFNHSVAALIFSLPWLKNYRFGFELILMKTILSGCSLAPCGTNPKIIGFAIGKAT